MTDQKLRRVRAVIAAAENAIEEAPEKAIVNVIGPVDAALKTVIFSVPELMVITSSGLTPSRSMPK